MIRLTKRSTGPWPEGRGTRVERGWHWNENCSGASKTERRDGRGRPGQMRIRREVLTGTESVKTHAMGSVASPG